MAVKNTLGLIAALLISFYALADELQIKPDHPKQYTVVRGDTLWDISGKFLQQPWLWPKLWHGNPQVKNPHLIYPGDVLHLDWVDGKPYLRLSSGREVKLYPSIRTSVLDGAIKMIPTDAIAQFLTSPKVLDDEKEIDKAAYIIDFPDEHIVVGKGDRVYARKILKPTTLNYTFFRKGEPYVSPETKEVLGYEAFYLGEATLNRAGDPATLTVTKSNSEIRIGDRLMENTEDETALNFFPKAPSKKIEGNILSVLNGVTQIGRNNIVVIDKGTNDGLEIGHVLEIHKKGRLIEDTVNREDETMVQLPDEKAGALIIFRPFKRVSYALIMKATAPIHILDKVKTPY